MLLSRISIVSPVNLHGRVTRSLFRSMCDFSGLISSPSRIYGKQNVLFIIDISFDGRSILLSTFVIVPTNEN